jgi:hypothetical protein
MNAVATPTDRLELPVPTADRRAVLHRLLDDSLAWGPEYGGGMASHLPMALAALDGLGASEAQMVSFFAHDVKHLQQAPAASHAVSEDWSTLRGRLDAFGRLRATFAAALARRGRDAVLRDALPLLADGSAGGALHGPIRVAHAVESEHAGELAAALAYWAMRWAPLPAPSAPVACFDSVEPWLDALDARLRDAQPGWRSSAPLISDRMQDAARTVAYIELAGGVEACGVPLAALLADLARAAAVRYASTGNFTLLHLATGARALQVLSPWLPTQATAWSPVWHAVAAASLASRAVPPRPAPASATSTWADVRRLACGSDDDHVVKLVHAMTLQQSRSPDPAWLAAARVAVSAR